MERNVLLILVDSRKEAAENLQKILTGWGCYIKTRLGIHDGTLDDCTETGLMFLELKGDTSKHQELTRKLNLLKGINAKYIPMSIN